MLHSSITLERCSCSNRLCDSHGSRRRSTALHATAAPSRYAAEETARKAAAVREQLRQHSSKHARQIHEQNVHIAELQQAVAKRAAQQQAEQQRLDAEVQQQQHWADEQQQRQQNGSSRKTSLMQSIRSGLLVGTAAEELEHSQQQQESLQARQQLGSNMNSRHPHTRQMSGAFEEEFEEVDEGEEEEQLQYQEQQQQQQQRTSGFYQLLRSLEAMSRSNDIRDWQGAACQCHGVLVPAVSGPQEAAAAWRLLVQLSGRRVLNKHVRAELGAAAAELAKVSLAHKDTSMLQLLLANKGRFTVGPRQLRDLATVAAAAGAGPDMLMSILDLAPACQLSSRAYFVVALTCFNRQQYGEAAQCLQRLADRGVHMSPALRRLQTAALMALQGV